MTRPRCLITRFYPASITPRLAAGFFSTLPPETLQAALHDQAAQVLVSIFDVLEDPALDDP